MWRRKRPLALEEPPAAEVTGSAHTEAPEVKIRAFRIGFVGAIGVLLAVLLGGIVGQLGTVILYVALALFLALGLDPLVSWLQKRMPRWLAILLVVIAVVGLFVGLIATIVPIVIEQTRIIVEDWPTIPPSKRAKSTPIAPTKPIRNARIFTSGARASTAAVSSAAARSGESSRRRRLARVHMGRS